MTFITTGQQSGANGIHSVHVRSSYLADKSNIHWEECKTEKGVLGYFSTYLTERNNGVFFSENNNMGALLMFWFIYQFILSYYYLFLSTASTSG